MEQRKKKPKKDGNLFACRNLLFCVLNLESKRSYLFFSSLYFPILCLSLGVWNCFLFKSSISRLSNSWATLKSKARRYIRKEGKWLRWVEVRGGWTKQMCVPFVNRKKRKYLRERKKEKEENKT